MSQLSLHRSFSHPNNFSQVKMLPMLTSLLYKSQTLTLKIILNEYTYLIAVAVRLSAKFLQISFKRVILISSHTPKNWTRTRWIVNGREPLSQRKKNLQKIFVSCRALECSSVNYLYVSPCGSASPLLSLYFTRWNYHLLKKYLINWLLIQPSFIKLDFFSYLFFTCSRN